MAEMRSVMQLADLTGRGAIVAGGAGHLGRAATAALEELGARVVALDVADGPVETIRCDLGDEAATRAAATEAVERLGSLDVLLHCAAVVGTSELEGWAVELGRQSVAAWDAALRVNLTSAFVLVQQCRGALKAGRGGAVVLFGSTYGLVGPDFALYEGTQMANPAAYAASKGGLLQLVRHLATALAPAVRVNAISPGGVERGQPESFQERYRARAPLRRMAVEEDVKGAVAFLASDLSAYVTGHNLVVDGGWTAW